MPGPSNPFLEDKGQALAMLLMSLGGGISQAGNAGQPAWTGIAPGVAGFAGAMGQQQQRREAEELRRFQLGLQERQVGMQEREHRSKEEERARAERVAMGWAPPGGAASVPGMRPDTTPRMGPGDYDPSRAKSAISAIEGDYGSVGPVANAQGQRAYGKYQVMDFNIGPWTQEVLGKSMTPQEFLANKEAQDKVFEVKFGQSVQKYGNPQDAASVWFSGKPLAGNTSGPDVLGTTVGGYVNKFNRGYYGAGGGPTQTADTSSNPTMPSPAGPQLPPAPSRPNSGTMIAQGSGDGTVIPAPPPAPVQVPRPQLPPEEYARIKQAVNTRQITPQQGDAEANRIITDLHNRAQAQADAVWKQQNDQYRFDRSESTKTDQWHTIGPDDAKMYPGLEPGKSYQRNKRTGEIKPIGAPLVTIDQKGQTEFAKAVGKNDAERLKAIQDAEGTMSDFASKISFAVDQFKNTYTGPGGEAANAFFKTLGAFGLEEFANKANAADAGMAMISQMKPHMRAAGSGASSDKDMDMFARALPGLLNLPGGNERVASYFQRLADRSTQIRQLAEEHSQGGTQPLTGTKFADEVKKLGPLFGEDERKEMMGLTKAKTAAPPEPPAGYKIVTPKNGGMSPMPNLPPPPPGFQVRQ